MVVKGNVSCRLSYLRPEVVVLCLAIRSKYPELFTLTDASQGNGRKKKCSLDKISFAIFLLLVVLFCFVSWFIEYCFFLFFFVCVCGCLDVVSKLVFLLIYSLIVVFVYYDQLFKNFYLYIVFFL